MHPSPRSTGRNPSVLTADHHRMARKIDYTILPQPDATYDWTAGVPHWGVMLNDQLGCCVLAATGHMIQAWSYAATGSEITVPDSAILKAYEDVGGYVPGDYATDNGADLGTALPYWQKTGIDGHVITAWAAVDPTDDRQCHTLGWLFGGLYAACYLPSNFNSTNTWDTPVHGNAGGHCYVPLGGTGPTDDEKVMSWGEYITMTSGFRHAREDECYAVLSPTFFGANGKTPHGFTAAQMAYFLSVSGGPPAPEPPSVTTVDFSDLVG